MNRGYFIVFFFVFFGEDISAQKKWDGEAGDGFWENPLNWVGNEVPTSLDDVVLDNSIFINSYTIIINGSTGTAQCRTIQITPNIFNSISLIIPATNLQSVAFATLGPEYSIELNAGSSLINASGATSGSVLNISDSMKINNGGRYIHRTQRGNASILNSLSSAPGTEMGIVEFDVPVVTGSYIVSMTNRKFGTLVFSSVTNNAPLSYISNGSNPVTIRGDLLIKAQVSLSVGFDDTIRVKGDFVHEGNIFNISNNGNPTVLQLEGNARTIFGSTVTESNIAQPVILFAGNSLQDINIRGSITNSIVLKLRKNGVVQLSSPLILPHILELKKGIIKSDALNLLTLDVNAEIVVDSSLQDSSFIDGPVRKIGFNGRDHFLFPVGKENKMRWLELKNITGDFTIEFFKVNPYALGSSMSGIDHISSIEYWTVESPSPASAKVELSFDNVNSGGVTELSSLRVAQLDGSWTSQGNSGTTGSPGASGSVVSNLISNFHSTSRHFSLASVVPNENPLPSKWIRLTVTRHQHQFECRWNIPDNWKVHEFVLEVSMDGIHFHSLERRNFDDPFQTYRYIFTDKEERNRIFRIKAIDQDGSFTYSNLFPVLASDNNIHLWLGQSFVSNQLNILVASGKDTYLNLILINSSGQVLLKRKIYVQKGSQPFRIEIPGVNAGGYQLFGFNESTRTNIIRVMKF